MSCEQCLSRREFLARATAAAALVSAGGCGDGVVTAPLPVVRVPAGTFDDRVTLVVGDFPALATPGVLVQVPDSVFAVKRTGATTFAAFYLACTHEGFQVAVTQVGQRFDCPRHGSRFNVNGSAIRGPAIAPLQTPPTAYDPPTDTLTINP